MGFVGLSLSQKQHVLHSCNQIRFVPALGGSFELRHGGAILGQGIESNPLKNLGVGSLNCFTGIQSHLCWQEISTVLIKIVNASDAVCHMQVSGDLKLLFLEFFSPNKHEGKEMPYLFKVCAFEGLGFCVLYLEVFSFILLNLHSFYPDC